MNGVRVPAGRVRLHRDPSDGVHLYALPAWVRPSAYGIYWHIPRSATRWEPTRRFPAGRIAVDTWCGQLRHVDRTMLTQRAPADLSCGTCVGRYAGYRREGGTIFSPHDHWKMPKKCPGTDDGNGWCFACGERVRYRCSAGGVNESRHVPLPALTERWEPCPRHGWRNVRAMDGVLRCTYWRCGE